VGNLEKDDKMNGLRFGQFSLASLALVCLILAPILFGTIRCIPMPDVAELRELLSLTGRTLVVYAAAFAAIGFGLWAKT
jgi:hypothetical protein